MAGEKGGEQRRQMGFHRSIVARKEEDKLKFVSRRWKI